jgi:hypothetical protein
MHVACEIKEYGEMPAENTRHNSAVKRYKTDPKESAELVFYHAKFPFESEADIVARFS